MAEHVGMYYVCNVMEFCAMTTWLSHSVRKFDGISESCSFNYEHFAFNIRRKFTIL